MVDLLQANRCGVRKSMWLDLNGASLPDVGQQLNTSACYRSKGAPGCYGAIAVTVLNCPGFFVYLLSPTAAGSVAYCATTFCESC